MKLGIKEAVIRTTETGSKKSKIWKREQIDIELRSKKGEILRIRKTGRR